MTDGLRFDRDGRLLTVTLCEKPLNVLGRRHIVALTEELTRVASDTGIDVVWLRAEDTRAFCAGVAIEDHLPHLAEGMLRAFQDLGGAFVQLPQVVVTEAFGAALGGGLELLLLSDLVVAAEDVKLGLPEITLASSPPIGSALLPARVGWQEAARVCLLGEVLDGAWAQRNGLITRLVPRAELQEAAKAVVDRLLSMSGPALRTTKLSLAGSGRDATLAAMKGGVDIYLRDLLPTQDSREGIEAFIAKRKPVWVHA